MATTAVYFTYAMLTTEERKLLKRINFSEDGTMEQDRMTSDDRRVAGYLVRKRLLAKARGRFEMTLDGRYVVEPEATTELYGPQGGRS